MVRSLFRRLSGQPWVDLREREPDRDLRGRAASVRERSLGNIRNWSRSRDGRDPGVLLDTSMVGQRSVRNDPSQPSTVTVEKPCLPWPNAWARRSTWLTSQEAVLRYRRLYRWEKSAGEGILRKASLESTFRSANLAQPMAAKAVGHSWRLTRRCIGRWAATRWVAEC
jgi:hypothetical protein